MNTIPTVSVCMITYGHEKFIKQAIEGVLMQVCDFEVELIIVNDCSPDATDEIIQDILITHPRAYCIKYIKQEKNIGMMPNFVFTLQQCKGKYIALCEGDDYWTNPNKLQKQVDYLNIHPDCSLTIHNVEKMDFDGRRNTFNIIKQNKVLDFNELLKFDFGIATCSWVFRNNIKVPDWLLKCKAGDWPLLFVLLNNGYCYYFSDIMGVYRKHIGGVSSTINSTNYNLVHIQALELFKEHVKHNKKIAINKGLSVLYLKAYIYERSHNHFIFSFLLRSLFYDPITILFLRKKTLLFWTLPEKIRKKIRR